jgi:hypothetical protein
VAGAAAYDADRRSAASRDDRQRPPAEIVRLRRFLLGFVSALVGWRGGARPLQRHLRIVKPSVPTVIVAGPLESDGGVIVVGRAVTFTA